MDTRTPDAVERLRRARAALVRAEEQAGLRSVAQRSVERAAGGVGLSPVGNPGSGSVLVDEGAAPAPGSDGPPGAAAGWGAEPVGHVLEVVGGGSLLRAAASVVPAGGWTGFVGVGDIGWLAAREAGIDLGRVVSVPRPGPLAGDVVATLLDGVDVLCVGQVDLTGAQRRRLAARVRRDGRVVLTVRAWPGVSRPCRVARTGALEAV